MQEIFQVRYKASDDEGDVFRSTNLVFVNYDDAILHLRDVIKAEAALIEKFTSVGRVESAFNPEIKAYTGRVEVNGVLFLSAWIETLSVQQHSTQHKSAALLDKEQAHVGALLGE